MAPPPAAMDLICAGVLDFLNGWALVCFLRTSRGAQACQTYLAEVQKVKERVQRLNQFLAAAANDGTLEFPGFKSGELGSAQLIPIDSLRGRAGSNTRTTMREACAMNPCEPTFECFLNWMLDDWPKHLERSTHLNKMVLLMNGPGKPLCGSPDLQQLSQMLGKEPWYAPSWTSARHLPRFPNWLAGTSHPTILIVPAVYGKFPFLLYIHGNFSRGSWPIFLRD